MGGYGGIRVALFRADRDRARLECIRRARRLHAAARERALRRTARRGGRAMTPRRKRLLAVLAILAGVGAATALAMLAFEDNLLYFYNPSQVARGRCAEGPHVPDRRHGHRGQRAAHRRHARGPLRRDGLPALASRSATKACCRTSSAKGRASSRTARLAESGEFVADEVLAKHDENYMPPEVAESLHTSAAPARAVRMIPELGHFALILALLLAIAQAVFGLGGRRAPRMPAWMAAGRSAVVGQFVFVALAFGALAWAFIERDFSVLYVASNSHSELPLFYRVAAVWGAHEGSLLLWSLVPRRLDARRDGLQPDRSMRRSAAACSASSG